ncbi:MAG: hypothetical protein AAF847_00360 [Bacteroidota bacterium]
MKYTFLLLFTAFSLLSCNDQQVNTEVEAVSINTEDPRAIPKEIYERETHVLQDDVSDVLNNFDQKMAYLDAQIESATGESRLELERKRDFIRANTAELKASVNYPDISIPNDPAILTAIEQNIELLAREIRDL